MKSRSERKALPPLSIASVAEARLRASSHTALRDVYCTCDEGRLVLEGRLTTFFHKQLAQELVADIDGVVQVVNHIEVVGSRQPPPSVGRASSGRAIKTKLKSRGPAALDSTFKPNEFIPKPIGEEDHRET